MKSGSDQGMIKLLNELYIVCYECSSFNVPRTELNKRKGKNKKGKYGKKGNQDQQSTDNNNAEKNNSSIPSTPTTPQTASALSAALFGSSSTPEPDELNEYVRPDSPEPEPVKAPMGKWAKKPEIKDTILKDDFVLPKAYRKEEPKRARKKKYRNINEHSDVILLPGRHMCDCQVSFYQTTEFIFFFYADSSIFCDSGACSFINDPQNDFSSSRSRSEGTFELDREFIIFSTTFSLAE